MVSSHRSIAMNDQEAVLALREGIGVGLRENGFNGRKNRLLKPSSANPVLVDIHITSAKALTIGIYWGKKGTTLSDWAGKNFHNCIFAEAWQHWILEGEKDDVLRTALTTFYRRQEISLDEIRQKSEVAVAIILEVVAFVEAVQIESELESLEAKHLAIRFPMSDPQ